MAVGPAFGDREVGRCRGAQRELLVGQAVVGGEQRLGIPQAVFDVEQQLAGGGQRLAADREAEGRVALRGDAKVGDKAAALKSFEKAAKMDSSKEMNKNLLLANLANGNTAEAKKYAAAADAESKAAMAAAEGDYKAAAKGLTGYNEAIALIQSNDLAGAKKAIAKDNSAEADYLRAVIAAKEGDLKTAEAQLKSAVSKNPELAQKAEKDVNLKALK